MENQTQRQNSQNRQQSCQVTTAIQAYSNLVDAYITESHRSEEKIVKNIREAMQSLSKEIDLTSVPAFARLKQHLHAQIIQVQDEDTPIQLQYDPHVQNEKYEDIADEKLKAFLTVKTFYRYFPDFNLYDRGESYTTLRNYLLTLVQRVAKQDDIAQRIIFELYYSLITSHALGFASKSNYSKLDAEDWVAEVFKHFLFKGAQKFALEKEKLSPQIDPIGPLLWRQLDFVVRDANRDRWRKYSNYASHFSDAATTDALNQTNDKIDRDRYREIIYSHIETLDDKTQQIFNLRFVEQMKTKDISEHMNMPHSTVRVKIRRLISELDDKIRLYESKHSIKEPV